MKKQAEYLKKIVPLINHEPETISEVTGIKDIDFICAVKSLFSNKEINDWFNFEKITLALNFKPIFWQEQQKPKVEDVTVSYFIGKKFTSFSEEICRYIAGVFVDSNFLLSPFKEIQEIIYDFLEANNQNLLEKVKNIDTTKEKEYDKESLEYFQIERYKELENKINEGG